MLIVLGSAWRNSAYNINRYICQALDLSDALGEQGHELRVLAVEGDSTDSTEQTLTKRAYQTGLDLKLVKHDHGGPRFGSVEDRNRMLALSGVLAAGFRCVTCDDDILIWVESDLIWDAHTMIELIECVKERNGFDVIAPLTFAGEAFYDVWGFRGLDGVRWGGVYPYHEDVAASEPWKLVEVSSVGSCLAMTSRVARSVNAATNTTALVGWCQAARLSGVRIAAKVNARIEHPA